MKKMISIVLAVVMLLSVCPITVMASTKSEDGQFCYNELFTKDGETYIEISSYSGTASNVVVPSEIDGKKVAGINRAFDCNKYAKEIVISEGVKYIEVYSFRNISDLSIELPSTLEYIGNSAFESSGIKSINFPEGLVGIDTDAFKKTRFTQTDIMLPESLKYISKTVFSYSNITSVHLGSQVIMCDYLNYIFSVGFEQVDYSIDETMPFAPYCSKLSNMEVDENNPYYTVLDNVLYSKDMKQLLLYPIGKSESVFKIPESVNTVAACAAIGMKLDKLIISNSVENIYRNAFYSAKIGEIEFEQNSRLKSIEYFVFNNLTTDCEITIPASVEIIETNAFSSSNVPAIKWEKNSVCTTIQNRAFSSCTSLKEIDIPASVRFLGTDVRDAKVFDYCTALETVNFEDNSNLTYWGTDLFCGCTALKTINIGKNSLLNVINCKFSDTDIENIDFSNCSALTEISSTAFQSNKNIKYINLDNTNISAVESGTFKDCSSLYEVILPISVDKIQSNAFNGCNSLEVINTGDVSSIDQTAFFNCSSLEEIPKTPKLQSNGEYKYYELENGIAIYGVDGVIEKKDYTIPDYIDSKPVIKILSGVFSGREIDKITLPDTIQTIGESAFGGANFNCSIKLPESIKYIGKKAFLGAVSPENEIVIPHSITIINEYTFYESDFPSIKIGNNVKYIDSLSFSGSTIEDIIIPNSVKYINPKAFNGEILKSITFGDNVVNIEEFIFNSFVEPNMKGGYCSYPAEYNVNSSNKLYTSDDGVLFSKDKTKLIYYPVGKEDESYSIPDGVSEISDYAFDNIKKTTVVNIPYSVKSIGNYAFAKTKSLKEIFIPNSIEKIGESAFMQSEALARVEFDSNIKLNRLDNTFRACESLKSVNFGDNAKITYLFGVFAESGIESIDLSCNCEYIEEVFNDSQLKEITIANGVREIEFASFAGTKLQSIVIPESVEIIGPRAFEECSELTYVNLSNTKKLDYCAFAYCTGLTSIDLTGVLYVDNHYTKPIEYSTATFTGCTNLTKFYFTAEEKEAYIAENEFEGNETVQNVVIGSSITEIKDRAFADCVNLETAMIAESVEEISDTAFENCDNLTIVCMADSPAMLYAERNNINYQTVQSFVVSPIPDQTYTGKAIKPALTVKQGGKTLKLGTDYNAVYSNNVNVGTARVSVAGLGDYRIFGTTVNFNIVKPAAHTHTYKTYITKATTKKNGSVVVKCSSCGAIKSKATVYYPKTVALSSTSYVYNSKVKKPSVTVKNSKGSKISSSNYTVTYSSGRKNVGTYTVTVKFKGNYSGTVKKTFTIKPKSTNISKLTKKSKGFTVKWKKQTAQVTGYQIQYSTSSKFGSKTTKTVTVSKNKTTSKTISKLKAKKKYYVRIRTYKTVNGKKIYSAWSSTKSVKTK